MSKHPSRFRKTLIAAFAIGSAALTACVAEVPARPGVDYGYVAGTGTYSTAPTPYAAAPYGDPYDDPYYDSYYGYNGPYYGGGYYYGPSTTFVYSRDHYYPGYGYGYRSRGNSYRDDRHPDSGDHNWHGNDHGGGGQYNGHGDHDGNNGHGNWNHDRPGRPDSRPGNAPPHQDNHPRPVMGGGRPGLGAALNNHDNRGTRSAPPRLPAPANQRRQQHD